MYIHTLYCGKNIKVFISEEILKLNIEDCFKIIGKQTIIMLEKGEYVKFENYERKIKSPFMIHADFERMLVPEDNGKQIHKSLIKTNIKNILLPIVAIN